MLQHNADHSAVGHAASHEAFGRRAHVTHAVMIGLHTLCCGLPIVLLATTALLGASSSLLALSTWAGTVHGVLHRQEGIIVFLSGALVLAGAWFERAARRDGTSRGFPWLFALSLCCFAFNVILIVAHRVS